MSEFPKPSSSAYSVAFGVSAALCLEACAGSLTHAEVLAGVGHGDGECYAGKERRRVEGGRSGREATSRT